MVVVAVLILITIVAAATAFYVADHDARPADSVGMAAHDTRDRTLVGGNRPVTREGPPS